MNAKIDQLVQSVLQKNTLTECSVSELQSLAEQYPFSSALQLLLTAKLKMDDPAGYQQQLRKTTLFFNNPLWLDYLLKVNQIDRTISEQEMKITPLESFGSIHEEQKPLIEVPALKTEIPESQKQDLVFEPYHTVDYFASQGIKIKADDKPQDKFGQQLKSFTEWLKILKQGHADESTKPVDTKLEQKVEQLAAHSLEDRNVVTEAMAEVWEKQGNAAKAIEIYNKLGLLNPSKSSYFAAKIDQLKKLN